MSQPNNRYELKYLPVLGRDKTFHDEPPVKGTNPKEFNMCFIGKN